jgi:pilus assembly protein CpaE
MILVIDPDARFAKRVTKTVGARARVLTVDAQIVEQTLAGSGRGADMVLVGPRVDPGTALDIAQRVQETSPEVSVVFVADGFTATQMQAALRAGVRDILPVEYENDHLLETVERAQSISRHLASRGGGGGAESRRPEDSTVVTVFSSKGGVGKSFVAANLAITLAKRCGEPVALVDLDLQFGDLAIMLQLFPARTMYDAAQNTAHLDGEAMQGYLARHSSNVHLLAAPFEPGLAETIPAEAVGDIIRVLRQSFRYVVIDSPAAFTDHIVAALDESDAIALLTSMDVPSIKNLKLAMQTLELLGIARERIRLVLNRADSEVGLRVQDVEKTLQTTVDVTIPSGREVPLSINRGVPLVTEVQYSPVVAALEQLAASIARGNEQPVAAGAVSKRSRLLRRKAG